MQADATTVTVQGEQPGAVILVHGVNDVGVGYGALEAGLCQGLRERLARTDIVAGSYRLYIEADRARLHADPDSMFFRRNPASVGRSPVIPFYWGSREDREFLRSGEKSSHGQFLDRHGNRLDRDGAKGGGPFNNATSALPDLWGAGASGRPAGIPLNTVNADPLRPVLDSPPRNYNVLAAERLAMLVRMIRQYHANETVSIVAHSQGCLVSLLAQALLAESPLPDSRPADTLVLCNPPYSVIEQEMERAIHWGNIQTQRARVETLANIVRAVGERVERRPEFATLGKVARENGRASKLWSPRQTQRWVDGKPELVFAERDNRGSVVLYFCPEDMTVALSAVQGIGWQGVPENLKREPSVEQPGIMRSGGTLTERARARASQPTEEAFFGRLAANGFFQRVFTMKKRAQKPGAAPEQEAVGAGATRFVLREGNESTTDHVDPSGRTLRSTLPRETRTINGPALPKPYQPNLLRGQTPHRAADAGASGLYASGSGPRTETERPSAARSRRDPERGTVEVARARRADLVPRGDLWQQ